MGGGEFERSEDFLGNFSVLLELAASDDLVGFRIAVEEEGYNIDEPSYWYGGRIGSKKIGFEERTPLMIAAMFGSNQVLSYVLDTGRVDPNRSCGSDEATALHCAVAGGSISSPDAVKLLLSASANANSVDANGNRPGDLIAPSLNSSFKSRRKMMDGIVKGNDNLGDVYVLADQASQSIEQKDPLMLMPSACRDGGEKKDYAVDISLPDINNGIYGTDEFRMYMFKVKPCSRAYSHDWTECPFAHPGENARRRDLQKYHYSCVPCPEFRKGTCKHGDDCEYAHGIFECWLHPAQYRTRLCKDETGCTRKVCFFAHKPEELRPLYASTGSAVPSSRSFSTGTSFDMMAMSPLALGSPSFSMISTSMPPMTPSGASSPMDGSMWQNLPNIVPPTLQLPGSRLKTSVSSRDMDFTAQLLELESHRRQQQQLMDEVSSLYSSVDRSVELNRLGGVKPTKLVNSFGSVDPAILPQLQGLPLDASASQMESPTGIQICKNMNQQFCSSPHISLLSSPVRACHGLGFDPSGSIAMTSLKAKAAGFANRSKSFIDRGVVNCSCLLASPASATADWRSPDGKLDWGIRKEELNKLRKFASFGLRTAGSIFETPKTSILSATDKPGASGVQPLVKDAPAAMPGCVKFEEHEQPHQRHPYYLNGGGSEMLPSWLEQLCVEQEQMVA